jgi:TRAP-type mannitol/chloroaromatic compound transport system substrate-binding protein
MLLRTSVIGRAARTAFLMGFAACASLATAQAQETIRWKVPVAFGTNLPALGDNILYVAQMINKASGGKVQLKEFEPGKLVPALSITDSVKDKKIEAGYTWLGYDQGKIPSSPLFSAVPFGMEPWEFMAWWYDGGGQKLAEEVYAQHGVHPILCGLIGPEAAGWFRNEIKSIADLKGLKIRFAGLGGQVVQKAGASVTLLAGGEIFQALEKGAIDATEFSMPAIDEKLGFDKIVKFNYYPGWHQTFTSFHLVVNKGVWDKLTEPTKALIELGCTAGVTRNLAKGEAIQGAVIASFKGKGVTTKQLPLEVLRELEKLTAQVMEEQSAKDPLFKKVYDSQKAFLASYRNWKSLAFLPRNF